MSAHPVADHPCFSAAAAGRFGRVHLPVAPQCNVTCSYCDRRYDCLNEARPGVCAGVLTPEAAVDRVERALEATPAITVAGIAGPGDPLANPDAVLRTLELVGSRFPRLHLCLSTNGLMLPDYVADLVSLGVRFLTVTMNAVTPRVGAQIYREVRWNGTVLGGEAGAGRLIERQLAGLAAAVARGMTCKVNTVLVPDVNAAEVGLVAAAALQAGVRLINVIPLLPVPGCPGGGLRPPTAAEVERVRAALPAGAIPLRHCRRCRADAAGLLGGGHGCMGDADDGGRDGGGDGDGGGRQGRWQGRRRQPQ